MKKRAIVSGLLVLLMILMTSGTAYKAQPTDILKKYENTSCEQILTSLTELPKAEFTQEVKAAFTACAQTDVNGAIAFAAGLSERINEYSENELISMITDPANDLSFRVTLVQLYPSGQGTQFTGQTPQGNITIRNLLLDPSVETILKENIIILFDFTDEEGIEMLQSIADGEDDMLAFQAIKKLNKFDSEDALAISEDILETYETQTPQKVNAALKVMSRVYRNARIQRTFTDRMKLEKAAFIDLCSTLISTSEKDSVLYDCAVFALSDMTDADAITTIVESSHIDDSFKAYAIDQNYLTLTDMVQSGSDEKIQVVCKAMEISPLQELREPLAACQTAPLTRSADPLSDRTLRKASAAVAQIESDGTHANSKWAQLYNEVD